MKLHQVPTLKIGTPYQRPSWRYDALFNPQKYGLVDFCSQVEPDAGFIKRLITKGIKPTAVFLFPEYLKAISKELPTHLAYQLEKVWNKNWKKTHPKKACFNSEAISGISLSWNIAKTSTLTDETLKKLVLHVFNYQYDEDIEFAIRFNLSEENSEIRRYFGYSFYAGLSDNDVAKRWNTTVDRVRTIRLLFFDFAHFPKDRVAAWALMRQLAEVQEIDAADFSRYKRIYELGELGIKAIENYHGLTEEEKMRVDGYLGSTAIMNTLNIHLNIRTTQDALAYNSVITNFAKLSILKEELRAKEAMLRLTELNIKKASKELNITDDIMYSEDTELLDAMREMSKFDPQPKFTSFVDLETLK